MYLVLKALLAIVLLVGEEGADPCAGPAEDGNDEGDLNFIAWMDELIIVDSPECLGKLDRRLLAK